EEAADPRWPLLERVKFLAIFHSNLDEFFMIRVAGLHTLLEQGEDGPGPDGLTAREQLERIGSAVRRLVRSASAVLSGELLAELIESHLDALFPGMRIVGVYPFRITRDMDMAILEAEADDLLQVVDRQVRRRRFGHVVRLEIDSQPPERIRGLLLDKLQLERDDLYECCSPLGA